MSSSSVVLGDDQMIKLALDLKLFWCFIFLCRLDDDSSDLKKMVWDVWGTLVLLICFDCVHVFWHRHFIPTTTDVCGASTMSRKSYWQTTSFLYINVIRGISDVFSPWLTVQRYRGYDMTHGCKPKDSPKEQPQHSSTHQNISRIVIIRYHLIHPTCHTHPPFTAMAFGPLAFSA